MKLTFSATLVLLLMVPLTVLGQNGTITGQVTDANGEVLPGANVVIQDLSLGSSTDGDGNYTIDSVPAGTHTVEVLFIGFVTVSKQATVASGQTLTLNFELVDNAVMLDAVVVTGTRTRGRTAMRSATPIDKLEAKELDRQGNGDMTETLKNLVPSYTATPLTGDGAAFIRSTSLRGLPPDDVLLLVNSKRRLRTTDRPGPGSHPL